MPIIHDRRSLASTIGLFILNFSTLDLFVQDYLENNLTTEEFARFKNQPFQKRIERIQQHVQQPGFDPKKRAEFERLSLRVEGIRGIRNHLAHGLLCASINEDTKEWRLTISLPRDLDGSNAPDVMHLTFEELLKTSKELTDLIDDFKRWTGGWVTDWEGVVERRES